MSTGRTGNTGTFSLIVSLSMSSSLDDKSSIRLLEILELLSGLLKMLERESWEHLKILDLGEIEKGSHWIFPNAHHGQFACRPLLLCNCSKMYLDLPYQYT